MNAFRPGRPRVLAAALLLGALLAALPLPARGEPAPGCALGELLAGQRPALAERLKGEEGFRASDRSGAAPPTARASAFAAYCKAVDRALKEAGDGSALAEWRRFRGLAPEERRADPVFPAVVAEYAALRYGSELRSALAALVSCRTTGSPAANPAAFARARAVIDSVATKYGVPVAPTADGAALTLTFGAGAPVSTFWGHLDVAPAGAGWSGDPWHGTFSDSAWVGRGVALQKGPALAAFFALCAVSDAAGDASAVQLVLRLNALTTREPVAGAGAGRHYFLGGSATPAGLNQRARLTFRVGTDFARMQLRLQPCNWRTDAIHTEFPGDWVPTSVELLIKPVGRTPNSGTGALKNRVNTFNGENSRARLEVRRVGDELYVTATGRPAPGALPELGQNPIIDLALFLQSLPVVCQSPAGLTALFLAENVAYERSGRGLGLSRKNESGLGTTLTVTELGALGDSAWTEFELYHPGVQSESEMLAKIRERLKIFNDHYGAGLDVSIVARTPGVASTDPAVLARLSTLAEGCVTEPIPAPAATEWSGRWNLPGAIPLGTLSPPERPNNLTDERTRADLVTAWMARVVRASVR